MPQKIQKMLWVRERETETWASLHRSFSQKWEYDDDISFISAVFLPLSAITWQRSKTSISSRNADVRRITYNGVHFFTPALMNGFLGIPRHWIAENKGLYFAHFWGLQIRGKKLFSFASISGWVLLFWNSPRLWDRTRVEGKGRTLENYFAFPFLFSISISTPNAKVR